MVSSKPLGKWLGFKRDKIEVVEYLGKGKYGKHWWRCRCDFGKTLDLSSAKVKNGPISCGHYMPNHPRLGIVKHGLHKHRLYKIWHTMRQRCYNPKATRYEYYGGKGIKLCSEWEDFLSFFSWANENGYENHLSIDRVDNNKDYRPDNCRWITVSENTRRAHFGQSRRNDGTYVRRAENSLQSA